MRKTVSIPVDVPEKSDDWRRKQLFTIGGNAAAAIMGKGYISPAQLWDRMHAVIREKQLPPPLPVNDDMRRGLVLEPYARHKLGQHYGCTAEPHRQDRFRVSAALPFAHALPDGTITQDRPIELKVPRPGTVARALQTGLPERWRLQAVHTMAVIGGVDWMPVGLLDPISLHLHVFEVATNPTETAALMDVEREFYESILADRRPDDQPVELLPQEPGPLPMLTTAEALEAARTWNRLTGLRDDVEEALAGVKAQLIAFGEGVDAWEIQGVLRCYNRPQPGRKTFNKEYVIGKYPDLEADSKAWKLSAPSRPFRTYDLEARG